MDDTTLRTTIQKVKLTIQNLIDHTKLKNDDWNWKNGKWYKNERGRYKIKDDD